MRSPRQGTQQGNQVLTRRDLRFLLGKNRGEPLQISHLGLSRLLSFHQVSPNFLEVLEAYRGNYNDDREIHFSAFRTSSVLEDPLPPDQVPFPSRQGRRYQISFNLKIPTTLEGGHGRKFYKIRQVALHHQLYVESGVQLWIVGDPNGLAKERIQKYLPLKETANFGDMKASFTRSLEIHSEILRWVADLWSIYVEDLQDNINVKARPRGLQSIPPS